MGIGRQVAPSTVEYSAFTLPDTADSSFREDQKQMEETYSELVSQEQNDSEDAAVPHTVSDSEVAPAEVEGSENTQRDVNTESYSTQFRDLEPPSVPPLSASPPPPERRTISPPDEAHSSDAVTRNLNERLQQNLAAYDAKQREEEEQEEQAAMERMRRLREQQENRLKEY